MGEHDSSKTRVAPVFEELEDRDPDGREWLARLLALPERAGAAVARPVSPPIIGAIRFGSKARRAAGRAGGATRDALHEAELRPALDLLRYMIQHAARLTPPASLGRSEHTRARRQALLDGDAEVAAEALEALKNGAPRKQWYVLEGPTRPDVFLATDDAVIVIEGKRTERGATTTTTWLQGRDQMLRHLDAAWEIRQGRRVYGFLIVEGVDGRVPDDWAATCAQIVAPETLESSLPHRSPAEREALAASFLGATTWKLVCDALGLEGFR